MANDRVYQQPTEELDTPSDQKARVYQEPVEVMVTPTSQKARVYQAVVEVLYPSANPTGGGARAWGYIIG